MRIRAVRTRVQKWGNSLAVRIPKSFAAEAGLSEDTPIEVSLADGKITVAPVIRRRTLEELVAGITDENRHPEVDTGPSVGAEDFGASSSRIK